MQTHRNRTNVSACYSASLRQGMAQLTLTIFKHTLYKTKNWNEMREMMDWWCYESASEEHQIDAKNQSIIVLMNKIRFWTSVFDKLSFKI